MSAKFQVATKVINGDLYMHPRGDFDGSSALELINLLQEKFDGKGQVIIDTTGLQEICPFGCSMFQNRLNLSHVSTHRLCFTGEKGYQIAPEGSKIVVSSPKHRCQCNGHCADCLCAEKKKRIGRPI
jgi:anti-anti-sigma regulatory factor